MYCPAQRANSINLSPYTEQGTRPQFVENGDEITYTVTVVPEGTVANMYLYMSPEDNYYAEIIGADPETPNEYHFGLVSTGQVTVRFRNGDSNGQMVSIVAHDETHTSQSHTPVIFDVAPEE